MKQIIFYLSCLSFIIKINILNSINHNKNKETRASYDINNIKEISYKDKNIRSNERVLGNLESKKFNNIEGKFISNNSEIIISSRKLEDLTNKDFQIWVFYDALCGDSRFYFKNSFRELYNSVKELNLNVNLNLIPGAQEKYDTSLTVENNDYNDFICKHGENECFANAVHACALFFFEKSLSFNFVDCYFDNVREFGLDIKQTAEFCLKKINKDETYPHLLECASGVSGKIQMSKNIQLKENVKGKVNRSPSIVINKIYNYMDEDEIESDTLGYLCKNYKIEKLSESDLCKSYTNKNYHNYYKRVEFLSKLRKDRDYKNK